MPSKGASAYRDGIRSSAYGYWRGTFDYDWAYDGLYTAIRRGIFQAWAEGAAACGIAPAELTPEETRARDTALYSELGHINGFLLFIEHHSKANGGKWGAIKPRIALWVNRYKDVVNQARVMACKDKKLMWVLGMTEEHCSSCLKLAGKIKRASYWRREDIRPQSPPNPKLECSGWNCGCELKPTEGRLSPGPLPRLP